MMGFTTADGATWRSRKTGKASAGGGAGRPKKQIKAGGGLARWFDEKWIDVCKLPKVVPCGRRGVAAMSYSTMKKKYPYCRPYKKVSPKTPKTAKALTPAQRKRLCAAKRASPAKKSRRA